LALEKTILMVMKITNSVHDRDREFGIVFKPCV